MFMWILSKTGTGVNWECIGSGTLYIMNSYKAEVTFCRITLWHQGLFTLRCMISSEIAVRDRPMRPHSGWTRSYWKLRKRGWLNDEHLKRHNEPSDEQGSLLVTVKEEVTEPGDELLWGVTDCHFIKYIHMAIYILKSDLCAWKSWQC